MKDSRRSKRMQKHRKRRKLILSFNLVSLMDIFTILVFFLLVNSSDVQVLPNTAGVKLPESLADKPPTESIVVLVNNKDILVQGRAVMQVADALATPQLLIPPLHTELAHQAARSRQNRAGKKFKGEVTIMGDREIPFSLLKKIMATCTQASYTHIALAVMKKTGKKA
jgi:biopolymer transport protein TolR